MKSKVPQVKRCCFCVPLRQGIIIFGILNMLFSLTAVTCLVIMTELHRAMLTNDISLEVVTSTVLFTVLGMGIILNVLLLVAGYQKDVHLLRLYTYYAAVTIIVAIVPACILVSLLLLSAGTAVFLALVMQSYVILVVRSEIMTLEDKLNKSEDEFIVSEEEEEVVDISDRDTLV